MSIEQTVANLTTQVGLVLDAPAQVATAANSKIAELTSLYQARAASRTFAVWVDPINGLDTNLGTQQAPFKTIAKVCDKAQTGSFTIISVTSDIVITEDIYVVNRSILIKPSGSQKLNISFERAVRTDTTPNLATLRGIRLGGCATVNLYNFNINVPLNDGTWPGFARTSENIISLSDTTLFGPIGVMLTYCTVTVGASFFSALIADGIPLSYMEYATTIVGPANLNGVRFRGVTNTAGTASSTLPWLLTNLATI